MLRRTRRIVLGSIAAAGLVAAAVGVVTQAAPALAATTFNVYMAPSASGGSDAHTGLSTSSPVLTMNRVQAVIRAAAPTTDVVVDILQGNYTVGETDWTYYIPGHTISFMAHLRLGGTTVPSGSPGTSTPQKPEST